MYNHIRENCNISCNLFLSIYYFSLYSDAEDSEAPAVEPDQSQPESKTNEDVTADQSEQAFSGAVLITSFETVAFRKKSLTSADG